MNERSCAGTFIKTDPEFSRLCRKALEKLDTALDLHPPKLLDQVDIAENAVARLRDMLIDRYRQVQSPSDASEIKRLLDSANTALSLIAGVVYPSGGIQRSSIEEARDVLGDAAGPCEKISIEGAPQ